MTSDDQVLNSGTAVFALDFSGASAIVNGVAFTDASDDMDVTTLGLTVPLVNDAVATPDITMDFDSVLSVGLAGVHGFGEIILSNLTAGQTYDLQLFAGGPGEDADSEMISDGGSKSTLVFGGDGSGVGTIVDTFVADGDETIVLTPGSGAVELNAINLREEVADAPEPSIPSLLAAGALVGLAARGFRRRAGVVACR